mgnify:CR=1 FL=1|tara:strand:+ start:63775 stop:64299 length:525 start_codon:yes stop_codon:yes gene_type:complete
MLGLAELLQNFKANFDGLDDQRRAQVLLYAQAIKLSKLEEFKKRERAAFEMVKNLFTFPGKFNKEQLELFSGSFIQNTQSCMQELEKGGSAAQMRDMENKLFASLLWAVTFGSCSASEFKDEVEGLWSDLSKNHGQLKQVHEEVIKDLNLDKLRLEIMLKASKLSKEEIVPILS